VYVLSPGAYPKATLNISVEDFGVATGGGIWVAAGVPAARYSRYAPPELAVRFCA
jgi:hypothetical protein